MNSHPRPRTYGQRIRTLIDLLRLYGKLDPGAAAMKVKCMTADLVNELKKDCPTLSAGEVL